MPIKALNNFSRDWKIQARIASKQDKRATNKGGSLLKIVIVDTHGMQIECTFFNKAADKFDPLLRENKVYTFSNGKVTMANKRFSSIKNDFTIIFEEHANIEEQADDGTIQAQAFEFVEIKDLQDEKANRTVDLCSLVAEVGESDTIKLKSGAEKQRRQVTLADDSNCAIGLTLWGTMCEKLTESDSGKIVAFKGVRVSDYLGKSLNAADDHASIFMTLKHDRVRKLSSWYSSKRPFSLDEVKNLTQRPDRPNQMMNEPIDRAESKDQKNSNLNMISEINEALQRENDTD